MRIILGVDTGGNWKSAASLLPRLRFRDGVVDTVHFVEPPVYHLGEPAAALARLVADESGTATAEGQQEADEASALLRQQGLITGVHSISRGSAAAGLMRIADEVNAPLIVVGSSGKGPVKSFFLGSVGRGILIGARQSVLIARGSRTGSGPLRAVLATDHSAYASRCIDVFRQMAPQGISHLTVLTVYPKDKMEALRPFLPDFPLDPAQWIEEGLEKRNGEVMEKLAPLGCAFDSRIVDGDIHESIRMVMDEAQADLLILGAQGHGFVDRLTLGSVSFGQALSEPHSVLVLRAEDTGASPAAAGEDER